MAGLLEVCVDSLASARAAIAGGADRLELCSALAVGGLTPYAELLKQVRAESDINIRCLMRPRGGDFLYSKEEILMMAAQIENLWTHKCTNKNCPGDFSPGQHCYLPRGPQQTEEAYSAIFLNSS